MVSENKTPKVVALVINFNQSQVTGECVDSLLLSSYTNLEIIIIDNGSSEHAYHLLANYVAELNNSMVTVIRLDTNIGYVGGINRGLEVTKKYDPAYILILNNDTEIDPSALSNLVAVQESHQNKAIVSGKVYNYDDRETLQYIGQYPDPNNGLNCAAIVSGRREKDSGQYDHEMEMGMLDDIFWLFPYSLYENIGGYSTDFFLYGEQNDFALRAKSIGYKLIYTPNARLWHMGSVTTAGGNSDSVRIEYWKKTAILKLAILHLNNKSSARFVTQWFIRETAKVIFGYAVGKKSWLHVRCHFLAYRHFTYWKTIRYSDNGYNPF